MTVRRTYVRPMDGWWRRDPFFLHYMAREATAIFVVAYALILLVGAIRFAQGEEALAEWLEGLRSPASVAFHALLLATFVYHTWSWFRIMPKTLPRVVVAGRTLPPFAITALGIAASVAASVALFVGFAWLAP